MNLLLDTHTFIWWDSDPGRLSALALAALRKKWTEAVQSCREALRLNPFEPHTRMLLIDCLIHLGEKKNAHRVRDASRSEAGGAGQSVALVRRVDGEQALGRGSIISESRKINGNGAASVSVRDGFIMNQGKS
jgi:hypothetical protein